MVVVCPKCDVALLLLDFHGVEVDYCPRCHGLWLDSGEVEHMVSITGGSASHVFQDFIEDGGRSEGGKQPYLCPRCDRGMREIVRTAADGTELILERCARGDGIWFDKGELHTLLNTLPPEAGADGAIALLKDVLGCYLSNTPQGDNNA